MTLKKIISLFTFCLILTFALSISTKTYASEGGKEEKALNVVIDTKDLSGVNLWIAETYNNDRLLYAIVVTLVMATLGSIMAFGTDLVLKYFGMTVTKISHSE